MVAVVTGTIKPHSEVGQLIIRDADERLEQYVDGLSFLVKTRTFHKIVFCDNSNSGTAWADLLTDTAKLMGVRLEVLSFQGDNEQVKLHGKGYGEGEIMHYVLNNSKLVQGEDFLIKITGRMRIDNIRQIVDRLKVNRTYFNIPNRTIRDIYDTRLYAMPLQQFREKFQTRYLDVYDDQGIYLEHIYTQVLNENKIVVTNFPQYPRIVGISGSTGEIYGYTEWKCKVRDILSRLGWYKVL